MTDATKRVFDVMVAVVGLMIAAFGLWRYFDEQAQVKQADAQARALALIEEHGGPAMRADEAKMYAFWSAHPTFVAHVRAHPPNQNEYAAFVSATLQTYEDQTGVRSFILNTSGIFERVRFCEEAGLCDPTLLRAYFCPVADTTVRVFGPFFDVFNQQIGATDIGEGAVQYADGC